MKKVTKHISDEEAHHWFNIVKGVRVTLAKLGITKANFTKALADTQGKLTIRRVIARHLRPAGQQGLRSAVDPAGEAFHKFKAKATQTKATPPPEPCLEIGEPTLNKLQEVLVPHFEVKLSKIKKLKIRTDQQRTRAAWVVFKDEQGKPKGQFIFRGLHYFTSQAEIQAHLKLRNAHTKAFFTTLQVAE